MLSYTPIDEIEAKIDLQIKKKGIKVLMPSLLRSKSSHISLSLRRPTRVAPMFQKAQLGEGQGI